MSNKTIGTVLLIAGVVVILAVIAAGIVGFPNSGFGFKKIAVGVVGLIAVLAGFGFTFRKKVS